jgi:Co/Zn/Cd efflux system component
MGMVTREADAADLRREIRFVAILNLAYFGIEFAVALAIGSVSLFADSIGLLEDASVNLLILVALRWSAPRRARLGMVLAGILLVPGLATERVPGDLAHGERRIGIWTRLGCLHV